MGIASVLSILVNVISFQKCVRISPYKNTKCHFKTPQQKQQKVNCTQLSPINIQSGRSLHHSPHPQCKSNPNLNDYSNKIPLLHLRISIRLTMNYQY